MAAPTLPRRPALDGVRALAVVAVLLHHARVPGFAGGYLGVDVFFVLSGFLITSLLLAEGGAAGRVDLRAFWARRARRLLPALFAVLLAVAAYAAWLAPATTRERLGGDALATLAYVANWRFVVEGTSYFDQYADPSPLLHTWSLAVEEQFYLVWPLLVAAALLAARGRRLERARPVWVAVVVAALGSALLTIALTPPAGDVGRAYYGTDVRAQQLLVGALLALWAARRSWWTASPGPAGTASPGPAGSWRVELVGVAGLAGVLAAVVLAADSRAFLHAGGLLVVSVAAAGVVAAAASPSRSVLQRVLELPPLVGLGVVSYGVYLWHWPLFVVLTPERTGLHGAALVLLRLGATLAVAVVSYRVLERPVRRADLGRLDPATRAMLLPGAAVATLAAVAVATSVSAPAPQLGPAPAVAVGAPAGGAPRVAPGQGGIGRPVAPPISVFVLGDSTAWGLHNQYPPAASSGLAVRGSTQLGCDLLGGSLIVNGQPQPVAPICSGWSDTWHQGVAEARPDVALLVTGNGFLFDRELDGRLVRFGTPEYRQLLSGFLDRTLGGLQASAKHVVVTDMVCFGKLDTGFDDTPGVINDVGRQRAFNTLLRELLASRPGVRLLDLRSYTCPQERYQPELDGVRLTGDGVHWTREGAGLVWGWLAPRLAAAARP